jgi:hypothetical protein
VTDDLSAPASRQPVDCPRCGNNPLNLLAEASGGAPSGGSRVRPAGTSGRRPSGIRHPQPSNSFEGFVCAACRVQSRAAASSRSPAPSTLPCSDPSRVLADRRGIGSARRHAASLRTHCGGSEADTQDSATARWRILGRQQTGEQAQLQPLQAHAGISLPRSCRSISSVESSSPAQSPGCVAWPGLVSVAR